MRELLVRADAAEQQAQVALEVYLHSLRGGIAAMVAALGGLDALVFTGGVGERSAEIRSRAVDGLDFLGLAIDAERNRMAAGDIELTAQGASAATLVIAAREDLEIARQTHAALAPGNT
jgi:acetate kinase